ncbi:lipid kinase, YegS/Rv2252/BmrU family [Melghirimyces thermohalophilus]|uniref:Lipid kinase, YegS/Rv2252/BmrU family n=1 Tax=Melghirimyces thermohalophilus TaxID=1236220 RepID=A0A1G6M475_9BACL|nr:diacylglycerol kinase family protein [Melghirimyces thermohalophilus]SDC50338.1 lipid kinase, YegS/Rv2252/BmrU family [Melghirimyces thermohalophilus]
MIVFIVNQRSGNGNGGKVWRTLEKRLYEKEASFEVVYTEYPGHATELAKMAAQKKEIRAVIAVGGDGTIHEVAGGLIGTSITLGCIPAGSGNDFARTRGISTDPLQALEQMLTGEPEVVDTLRVNGEVTIGTAGVGFDASVSQAVNRSSVKRWLKKAVYVWELIRLLFTFQPQNVTVTLDGNRKQVSGVWLIAVANIPFYGGGMKICPEASNRDGLLDICIVRDVSRWKILFVFPRVFQGTHVSHPAVEMMKGTRLEVESSPPLLIHTDGEVIGKTPVEMEIVPNSLQVI